MYSNTAYEALYQILGLQFQEQVTHYITSQVVFRAAILIIFSVCFFLFLLHFASRYLPFVLSHHRAPISRVIGLIFCLFLGISILKVGSTVSSESMLGLNWSQNRYVASQAPTAKDQYNVSLIFRLISGSAEEMSRLMGSLVDSAFSKTNLQMTAPNLFYKAMLGAAADSIGDPALRSKINYYTDECLSKILPDFNPNTDVKFFDRVFSRSSAADQKLAVISLGQDLNDPSTCLDLKQNLNQSLSDYAHNQSGFYKTFQVETQPFGQFQNGVGKNYDNWVASTLLVNHYLSDREGSLGVENGAKVPGTAGRVFQYLGRMTHMDGWLSLFNSRDMKGASVAASRSNDLSDHFARAPHVAGFIKMLLIGLFPFLVFFLAAGKWRPLIWWWLAYFSVCMWTPAWALLYHVVTGLALGTETLDAMGGLNDGVSLYAATLVSSRLYQAYAVYAWLQLAVAAALSGGLLRYVGPLLMDHSRDHLPEGVSEIASLGALAVNPAVGTAISATSAYARSGEVRN